MQREKWVENLVLDVQFVCTPTDGEKSDEKEKGVKMELTYSNIELCLDMKSFNKDPRDII